MRPKKWKLMVLDKEGIKEYPLENKYHTEEEAKKEAFKMTKRICKEMDIAWTVAPEEKEIDKCLVCGNKMGSIEYILCRSCITRITIQTRVSSLYYHPEIGLLLN